MDLIQNLITQKQLGLYNIYMESNDSFNKNVFCR